MKKFIQISLITILVLMVFQAAAGAPVVSPNQVNLVTASNISSSLNTIRESAHAVECLIALKRGPGAIPTVGWNS